MAEQKSEIAFFDLETTVPKKPGQGYAILEFGAILVCPNKLIELDSYSTLVCPNDLSLLATINERKSGITRANVSISPPFYAIADKVFDLLNGRIWVGHNILRFDCARIREAFAQIDRAPPEAKWIIDSLALLTERFGRRAGDMKMATLATYFELGTQTHRSLDDVRMNLEVLKYCATVLLLESSLPDILTSNSWVSPCTTRRTRSGGRLFTEALSMNTLSEAIIGDAIQDNNLMKEQPMDESPVKSEGCSSSSEFFTPDDVSISSINVSLFPFYHGNQRIRIMHNDVILKLHCTNLKVRFGISTKYADQAGRPRLSFVVDAPLSLCQVLDACDSQAQKMFMQSGSLSDWRSVVSRKKGFWNFPTVRLQIPTVLTGDVARYGTEIFDKEAASGAEQKLIFSTFNAAELEALFTPGTSVDAFFLLDPYDFHQNAGIRLVAEKLVIHPK